MAGQTMTASEHAQRALDLLAEADDALAVGEYERISGTLWSAVEHAIAAVAVERGWECEGDGYLGLRPVVQRLGEDLTGTYDAASLFYHNSRYTFLDDYEFEFFTPSAHRFVSNALKLKGVDQGKVATGD